MLSWALVAQDRVPLFVRLPARQARSIDELVDASGRRKQDVVSDLLSDRLAVGRIDLGARTPEPSDVLTLAELAELLRVTPARAAAHARAGDLPGRRVGREWRFSRAAVMAWLAAGEPTADDGGDRQRL
jgi:excisionase family DNA binding protein